MSLPNVATLSEAMKPVKKYYAQAKQLEKVDPRICYLCRLHAAREGMKLKKTPEDMQFVVSLMDWLENNNCLKGVPQEERSAILYDFISKLFYNADTTDRTSPVIDDDLAKAFLAISILIDVFSQFGPLPESEQQRRKYCQWKAVEIRKALREGRPHVRGGFGEEESSLEAELGMAPGLAGAQVPAAAANTPSSLTSTSSSSSSSSSSSALPAASSLPTIDQVHPAEEDYQWTRSTPARAAPAAAPKPAPAPAPKPAPAPTPAAAPAAASRTTPSASAAMPAVALPASGSAITIQPQAGARAVAISSSDKLCKHAVSAMNFDDVRTAVAKLSQAIALLLPHMDQEPQY